MIKSAVALLLLLASLGTLAQSLPGAAEPPNLSSKAFLLLDFQSGHVIASRKADERIEPASLTKLMTAYVAFDALHQKRITLEQRVTVSEKAWRAPGSRMFLEAGSQVTVEQLLHGLIVQSGNDAAVALAEAVGGSESAFAEMMNREASRLGLRNTRFVNATGLPDGQHYSSAADIARIAQAITRDYPRYFPMYSLREYSYNGITQYNRNKLLGRDPHVDGMKTGFTESAGFCLVATAERRGRRLISVVIDAGSDNGRAADSQRLLNYGFEQFETVRLYARGQPVHRIPVWKGVDDIIAAGFAEDLFVTVPRGLSQQLRATLESMQPLLAPIRSGQPVGKLRLIFDDQALGEYPVVALENVSVANMFVRAWHSLRLLFN
jgi:serine-type D-Ala-D-Ala carboxypeptidase (penicillin-binding protein 5/6)